MANKDIFNLKKKRKKPASRGIWRKDMAPPERMVLDPKEGEPPFKYTVPGTDPRLRGRKAARGRGSRVVKPRPMKGVPRNIKPELAKDAKARREKYKRKPLKKGMKSTPIGKIGVRTGASGLSKLVKAMNK